MQNNITLPLLVQNVLERLEKNGFSAYVVGGCVRDSLQGKKPHDWDICTSALPQQVKEVFRGCKIVETGIAHGTVTLFLEGQPFEITTFRTEGNYTDGRRPDSVSFSPNIEDDLSRRDFTINAMAYNPNRGLVDLFGGRQDLQKKVLRCVGNPHERLREDALRILRGVRFCAGLGLKMDAESKQALQDCVAGLEHISVERIFEELTKLLCGEFVVQALLEYDFVLFQILPQLQATKGFEQHNPYHIWDVWRHTVYAVGASIPDPIVRLALLFHDIGKPLCFHQEKGVGHFYGHANISFQMSKEILEKWKVSIQQKNRVCRLVKYHDSPIWPTDVSIKRWLNRMGVEDFFLLLEVKRGDARAKAEHCQWRLEEIDQIEAIARDILRRKECFSLKKLNISGKELLQLGFVQGKEIGKTLDFLLSQVMQGMLPNEPTPLQQAALQYRKKLENK